MPLRDMPPPAIETGRFLPAADIWRLSPGHHAGTAFGLQGKRTSGRAGVSTVSRGLHAPALAGLCGGEACARAYECVCTSASAKLWSGLSEAAWLQPWEKGALVPCVPSRKGGCDNTELRCPQ